MSDLCVVMHDWNTLSTTLFGCGIPQITVVLGNVICTCVRECSLVPALCVCVCVCIYDFSYLKAIIVQLFQLSLILMIIEYH